MKPSSKAQLPSLMSLKMIFEGTSPYTGKPFFRSLVKHLAEILGVHGVWITLYKEKEYRLHSLAFWLDGDFVDHYEYNIRGTPCEPVIKSREVCHVPDKVIELYPNDPDLPPLGAVSYMGIALNDEQGKVIGHLALLDTEPMEEIPEVFVIFKLFASRAGAELRRMQYEKRLQESEKKIDRLLNGTMDAIIEMNSNLIITQANAASLSLFQVTQDHFVGQPIRNYLHPEAFQKLLDTLPSLKNKSYQPASLWIQGHLYCLNSANQLFPADATLSCYSFENQTFYALYVRNVQDRLQKEEEIKKLTMETTLLQERVNDHQMSDIIGESEPIVRMLTQIQQVAPTDSTVLILGKTGTGKELVAREIHQGNQRKNQPLITLNCAALPKELIESELFGHVKGAYTGATGARNGRFKLADQGTIFLDEVGELPLGLQAKLLRVIQEGEFEPVGSSKTEKVNVRIIAATHRNLKKEVANQRFREDLYYRLNVFPVQVPPLRKRGHDIILLAEAFLQKYAERYGRNKLPLSQSVQEKLLQYTWPGNVRELQNIMERTVITSQPESIRLALTSEPDAFPPLTSPPPAKVLTQNELQQLEIKNLHLALQKTRGKVFGDNGAARLIGLPPTTLNSKLKKYGIDPKQAGIS